MRRYTKRHTQRFKQLRKREDKMKIEIWTDGGCEPNPGTGGWAAILKSGDHVKEISGRLETATSNTAELTAVIEALKAIHGGPHEVVIYTDSQYTQRALDGMRKPKANLELLNLIKQLKSRHVVKVEWIRGHTGNVNNERCDALAREMIFNGRY